MSDSKANTKRIMVKLDRPERPSQTTKRRFPDELPAAENPLRLDLMQVPGVDSERRASPVECFQPAQPTAKPASNAAHQLPGRPSEAQRARKQLINELTRRFTLDKAVFQKDMSNYSLTLDY